MSPAVVLGATLAAAIFAPVTAALLLLRPPQGSELVLRLTVQQDQHAKTLLYLLGFGVITPACALAGLRLSKRIATRLGPATLTALTAGLAGSLALVVVLVRLSRGLPWDDGLATLLVGSLLWDALALVVVVRTLRGRPPTALAWLARRPDAAMAGAALATVLAVLCFTHLGALRLLVVVAGTVAAAVAVTRVPALPRLRRRWGLAVDVLILALVALAIPDVVVYFTANGVPNTFASPGIVQYHHDYLLGPTNQVLGGGTLLVDSPVSQYGVGTVYFLAAWFNLAPIGYGSYALLDGLLTAACFCAGYGLLRLLSVPRPRAAIVIAVAVVALVLHRTYTVGALPQQGPLRFGLPMLLLVTYVVHLRRDSRLFLVLALASVGLAAIWAIEAFVYSAMTFGALTVVDARLRAPGHRLRWLGRRLAAGAVACVAAHLLLALFTLVRTGHLPDWGDYLAYLRAFLGGGKAGSIVYGFEPWSPALPLAAVYAVTLLGVGALLRRPERLPAVDRRQVVVLAGLAGYGIALFSYTQNRASTYLLAYVALPGLLAAALWLELAVRRAPRGSRLRWGALVAGAGIGLVLLASALPVGARFSDTPLARLRPGGGLHAAAARLWHSPPIDPRAPEAQRMIETYLPGRHVLVLLPQTPELMVEALMRSGRANRLPVGNPAEETFVPNRTLPPLRAELRRLHAGDRVLIDDATLAERRFLRRHPEYEPLADPNIGQDGLDAWAVRDLDRRFDLSVIARGGFGMKVVRLVAR